MKTIIISILTLVINFNPLYSIGQDTIRLTDLFKALNSSNPISKIPSSIDSVYQLKQSNLKVNYLPKLDINGSATWQSDVTALNISLPIPGFSIPKPDHDQYKVTLDVSQLIWDGGSTESRIELEERNRILERNKIDVEMYGLKERLTNLYFNLVLLDVTKNQLELMQKDLARRVFELESGVRAGMVLSSTIDAIKAEQLKLLQNLDAIPAQKNSLISSIRAITGIVINENDKYILPIPIELSDFSCLRPELSGFGFQKDVMNASSNLVSRKHYPILAGFVQGGYGKPGLNMLSNNWDTFYLLGAKLSWNIWDWNSASREKQQFKVQQGMIDRRKDVYLNGYNAQIESIKSEISKLRNQLEKDNEIINLLHGVTERSSSSLKNGTITSANYISDFNAESRARLDMETRKIMLSLQIVTLYNLTGNDIK
ncbi:MAG: TolC family protein [Bacteroidales bacterium]|nr:TolC family protein [Bacteroidales bacterium]